MKKPLRIVLLLLVGVPLLLFLIVNAVAPALPELPPPDLELPIHLADGTEVKLGALIEGSVQAAPAPKDAGAKARAGTATRAPREAEYDLIRLGRSALHDGRIDEALAIWHAVPPDHPDYAMAMRYIGYKIYVQELGEPSKGIAYVNLALSLDFQSGNAWQDFGRTYASTLGLDL